MLTTMTKKVIGFDVNIECNQQRKSWLRLCLRDDGYRLHLSATDV